MSYRWSLIMNKEINLNLITSFADNRFRILNSMELLNSKNTVVQVSKDKDIQYTESLMQCPVSKLSKFSDDVWDFNEDYPNAARNIQGARLRMDFYKYPYIPVFVLTEIKILLYLVLLNNLIFKNIPNNSISNSKKRNIKGNLKPQSLTPMFKTGLNFLNTVFEVAINELGSEFVNHNIKTLADVNQEMYAKAASKFNQVKGRQLEDFFKYLYSSAAYHYVFNKQLPYVDIENFDWKKLPSTEKKNKNQVLSNNVFEKLSKISSFIILDFLEAIGDTEKISDIASFERLKASNYSSWSSQNNINRDILNAYTALRLKNKGYDLDRIENLDRPYEWLQTYHSEAGLLNNFNKLGFKVESIRQYFCILNDVCVYIVGQYTGMRPSELAEIRVQNCECLVESNGVWLIESTVKKHTQEIHTGLFDDRWVAIPIIRDAILVASYIAKIKASPYLLANVNTVSPNEKAQSMVSKGIKYQINRFITYVYGEKTASDIDFYPYMLRHTLTYQLFRADVGLSLISFQLKHFVDNVAKYTSHGATSAVTLGYGEVGEILSKDGSRRGVSNSFRRDAELEMIKTAYNPNGVFYGGKATELKERLAKLFQGYQATGCTEEEVYEAMVDQGFAIVNVGQGLCYGENSENFDSNLPCIGTLRCNPIRCSQAVVTKSHAPKWREVYILNKANLNKPEYAHNREQILAVMNEAKLVLENLGEEVEL